MKNNVGDIPFDTTPDRYSPPIRAIIYSFTFIISPLVILWIACKQIGELKRYKGK